MEHENPMQEILISDIYQAAFLILHDLPVKAVMVDGRVLFSFPYSFSLRDLTNNFNSNADVPVGEYTLSIKKLRSMMYDVKSKHKE